jgi:decaprenylphospho-beta-D-ribofuranose 2-oxidase
MKKHIYIITVVLFLCVYSAIFFYQMGPNFNDKPLLIQDVSRLFPVEVREIVQSEKEEQLVAIIKEAKEKGLKISIAGAKHSQGGHVLYPDSVHLDMTTFNKILEVNKENKTARVQSGATWKQVQEAVNPHGLSVKVMQSSNIFTVGGSLSVNAHGRDVRYGPMIETVNSFHLLNADGDIINVSRQEKPELFYATIGGYGLFGVILDVELQLTDDVVYEVEHDWMDYKAYPVYFKNEVLGNAQTHLHIARLSTAPSSFLTEMYASNFTQVKDTPAFNLKDKELIEEENIQRNKMIFGLARSSDWGKERLWDLQKILYATDDVDYLSRNNAMRPEVQFLEYTSDNDTDILQEYFIPLDQFASFVDDLRQIIQEDQMNVFNITVRYVPQNEEAMLSYSTGNMFAIVLLINQGLSEEERAKAELTTQRIVDAALKYNGTYYLTYQLYPTDEQFEKTYLNADDFFDLKLRHDPSEMFMNQFYERYAKHE